MADLQAWPRSGLYDADPAPVSIDRGLLFAPWKRDEARAYVDRVRAGGLSATYFTYPADRGIRVCIKDAKQ